MAILKEKGRGILRFPIVYHVIVCCSQKVVFMPRGLNTDPWCSSANCSLDDRSYADENHDNSAYDSKRQHYVHDRVLDGGKEATKTRACVGQCLVNSHYDTSWYSNLIRMLSPSNACVSVPSSTAALHEEHYKPSQLRVG